MTGEPLPRDAEANRFYSRGATAESPRTRASLLRTLTLEERGQLAIELLAFARTMRQSTGPRARRPLDRSLATIAARAKR